MSMDIIEHGKALVHRGLCPACNVGGNEQPLQAEPPTGFHWHGGEANPSRPYLFCPVDGQGYRIADERLLILPPCNGGLHPEDVRGGGR